jgi:hypothetical protein
MDGFNDWMVRVVLSLLLVVANSIVSAAQEAFVLPSAKVGVAYEYALQAEGGLPPLQWNVVGGDLPKGIMLSATGTIKGIPTGARQEPFEFSVEVADSEQPPQRFVQRLKLGVVPSELHIVLPKPALKIVPPANSADTLSTPPSTLRSQEAGVKQASFTPARALHWVVPVQASASSSTAQTSPANDIQDKQGGPRSQKAPLDPATFIRIIEDTKEGSHLSQYVPVQKGPKNALQFAVDLESSVLIAPDPEKMGEDPALNKLYITAKLASGDSSKDLVVTGYSEIGKDKSSMTAQSGAAFQSAANVEAMIFNMAYTVGDIIRYVYLQPAAADSGEPQNSAAGNEKSPQETLEQWLLKHGEVDFHSARVQEADSKISAAVRTDDPFSDPELQRLQARLRLYQPEIKAISDFFLQSENLVIVERIGVDVFWIDRSSLQLIAQQYQDNVQIAFDAKSTPKAQAQALEDLLERTKLVYQDFGVFRNYIREQMKKAAGTQIHTDEEWNTIFENEILKYSHEKRKAAFAQLKTRLATGSISLPDYQAKDGDRLTITVESLPADSTTGGVPVVFYIAIKKYGAKIQWSPSLLFVRRLGVTDAEVTPPTGSTAAPLNRVNFAPSPGMTFGVAYFKRGQSGGDKFMRALGPGIGMNVTFMNFNDPSFDLATNKFVATTGTNVQVGAGVIGSLFDNKLQFSYGWNLNVENRRDYFGVGFGFIEIGKELTKYIGK